MGCGATRIETTNETIKSEMKKTKVPKFDEVRKKNFLLFLPQIYEGNKGEWLLKIKKFIESNYIYTLSVNN